MNPVPDSIEASKKALMRASARILRICLERNGTMAIALLEEMAALSFINSGGRIKFGVMEKRKQ